MDELPYLKNVNDTGMKGSQHLLQRANEVTNFEQDGLVYQLFADVLKKHVVTVTCHQSFHFQNNSVK